MTVASTAPMPGMSDLLAVFNRSRRDATEDGRLAAPWLGDGDTARWFSRATWGLKAIVDAHRTKLGTNAPCLWLPDYFCNQATWPLRQARVELVFYPIDETLGPDWNRCEALAKATPPNLFLQVHYFGFPAALAAARSFCRSHGAALIEDATHVLAPFGSVGEAGDYVLYSLYKHLPLPDGGLLLIRPTAGARTEALSVTAAVDGARAGPNLVWFAKRTLQVACPGLAARIARRGPARFDDDPAPGPLPERPLMSTAARRLLVHIRARLDGIAAARRANERALREALAEVPGISPLFDPPSDQTVPYRAVFRAENEALARLNFDRFRANGGVVETWPDLAPEVMADKTRHAVAISLRRTVLALPIHAGLQAKTLVDTYGSIL